MSTIFKKIIDRKIEAEICYEDDLSIAFKDTHPKAKAHVLLIPKEEIATLDDMENKPELIGHLMSKVPIVARKIGLTHGYKVHIHCKEAGGQEVYHLHIHILGDKVEK